MRPAIGAALMTLGLSLASAQAAAVEPPAGPGTVQLSPDLLALLRAEMAEVSKGMQTLVIALAAADWPVVAATGAKIRASYLMAQQLTPAQAAELRRSLPEHFRQLDAGFHARAGKLEAAAHARDAELAVIHYQRLIESCVSCHSAFEASRFPGFGTAAEPEHHHH